MSLLEELDTLNRNALPTHIHPTQWVDGNQPFVGAGNVTINPNTGVVDFTVRPGDTLARVFAGNNGGSVKASDSTFSLGVIADANSTSGIWVDGSSADNVSVFGTNHADTITNGGRYSTEASVYRLYQAMFDRDPDMDGFNHWNQLITDNNLPLVTIAQGFTGSQEFANINVADNGEYVRLLYNNVLDREPDQGGFDYWVSQLNSGVLSRAEVLVSFSESPEFIAKTAQDVDVFLANAFPHQRDAASTYDGDDFVEGGNGHTEMRLGNGNDTGSGNGGNDLIFGEAGNDHLNGGAGNDTLWGGLDDDTLIDTSGLNRLHAEQGNDDITTNGISTVFTGAGNDTVRLFSTGETGATGYVTFEGTDGTDGVVLEDFEDATIQIWSNPEGLDTVLITDQHGQQTQITAAGNSSLAENFAQYGAGTPIADGGYVEADNVNLVGTYIDFSYDIA